MLKKLFSVPVLKKLFIASIAVKIFVSLFVSIEGSSGEPKSSFFHFYRRINNDEQMSAHVAFNYNNGFGFTDSVSTFHFGERRLELTAYRPTFPIVVHILFQKVYENFSPVTIDEIKDLDSHYFNVYALLVHYSSLLLFLISIPFFKRLVSYVTDRENIQYSVTIVYVLNPASLYYLGLYPLYENIVLPLIVIAISKVVSILRGNKTGTRDALVIAGCITLSCHLRPHILISVALVIAYLFLLVVLHYKKTRGLHVLSSTTVLLIIFMAVSHGLIVYKNYHRIGRAVLSTESSQAFYFGHNPYTRGSWVGEGTLTEEYLRKNIPGIDYMSEAQLYDAHKKVTWEWIKANPLKEAELFARKTALYLLPYNYGYLHFNIIIFLIHFGFVGFCFLLVFDIKNRKFYSYEFVFSMLIILGSFLMTYYAFFEYRYTYYAQPFMMLLATYFYLNVKWSKLLPDKA